MFVEQVSLAIVVLLYEFALVTEWRVAATVINRRMRREDGMHVPACACLRAALKRLRERVLLVALLKNVSMLITQYFIRIDSPQSEIGVPVDHGEEVLSPAGVFEGLAEQAVQVLVVRFLKI